MVTGLLAQESVEPLRSRLHGYTEAAIEAELGLVGVAATQGGDLDGARLALADSQSDLASLARLFRLGLPEPVARVRELFGDTLAAVLEAGLVVVDGDLARAGLQLQPVSDPTDAAHLGWVVADLPVELRRGRPLQPDHVMGAGNAAWTLLQMTPRTPVGRALDLGTGCGIQSLALSRHADSVTATDISRRALHLAATSAQLSGARWDLRLGSFEEPVDDELFDLVVANPPFVLSPGSEVEHDYRDGGRAGDGVSAHLAGALPRLLAPGGTAQLLANWLVPTDGSWQDRIAGWLAGSGCTCWVWQRDVAELGQYVTLWLRDAGHVPGSPEWARRYDHWLTWLRDHGAAAVGMGAITIRATGRTEVVFDEVPQPIDLPIAGEVDAWFDRSRLLADLDGRAVLGARWRAAPDLVLSTDRLLGATDGWVPARSTLRQSRGMRWELEVDDAVAAVVAACAAGATPMIALQMLAAAEGVPADPLVAAATPVLRDLIRRGFLLPVPDPADS